jgi:hypothetical protein
LSPSHAIADVGRPKETLRRNAATSDLINAILGYGPVEIVSPAEL